MKIILSRKGFDSSVGGCASPILPDGTMLSLPIPTSLDVVTYDELRTPGDLTYARIIRDLLGEGSSVLLQHAHLDPDLASGARARAVGWRGTLGQIGAAAGHLKNQHVGPGDLFLFYGWFRHANLVDGRLHFRAGDSGFHAVFGYLEVAAVLSSPTLSELPDWLRDHPHAIPKRLAKRSNTFYVASQTLSFDPLKPGWGPLCFRDTLVLSDRSLSRSRWCLNPQIFQHLPISYHTSAAWKDSYFQSYPRAQEYVIQADEPAANWACQLVRDSARWN